MGWNLNREKQDPFAKHRKSLEKKATELSRKKAALEEEIRSRHLAVPELDQEPEPPTWNPREGESFVKEEALSRSRQPRPLSVHRHRDRNLFIALASVLLVIVIFLVRAALH